MKTKFILISLFFLAGCTTAKVIHSEDRTPQSESLPDLCSEHKDYVHFSKRVVTLNNGSPISADIDDVLPNGTYKITTDYTSRSPAPRGAKLERKKEQLSPAVQCLAQFRVNDHVLFIHKDKMITGIVFEVFANGTLRIIDEDINEKYATIKTAFKQVPLKEKNQNVIFNLNYKKKAQGQLKSQYTNGKVIIKYDGQKLVRDVKYIQFQN